MFTVKVFPMATLMRTRDLTANQQDYRFCDFLQSSVRQYTKLCKVDFGRLLTSYEIEHCDHFTTEEYYWQ